MWVSPALSSGLGNRLFQYAAAAGAAEEWARDLILYMPRCKESPHGPMRSLFDMFPTTRIEDSEESFTELKEHPRGFYVHMPLGASPKENVVIDGFRQSHLYFPKNKRLIQPDWTNALGGAHIRKRIEALADLTTREERLNTYAIHMRLGDYRLLPHHQVDLLAYYLKAIERIPRGSRVHVFSDDPNDCIKLVRGMLPNGSIAFRMSVTKGDVESLYEMSLCLGGTITANSTFSWWGAWFAHENGAKWATYPDSMGNGMPDPTNLYPEWGTIIPTKAIKIET